MKVKQEELLSTGEVLKLKAERAYHRSNENEQYSRNYNLRIYNINEPKDETPRQCEEKVLQLFHDRLGMKNITTKDKGKHR